MKRYILVLGILLIAWGCDDFLTVRPKSDIVESELFLTSEGFEDALYGAYAKMAKENLYGKNLSFYVPDVLAQMYTTGKSNEGMKEMSQLHHNNDDVRDIYNGIWKEAYEAIGYVNNILKLLSLQDKSSMKYYSIYYGEALGLRAFLHFDLVRLFAPHIGTQPNKQGIPYVRQWSPLVTPFSTVKEVYAAVIDDLKKAEGLLKEGEENMGEGNDFTNNRQTHFNYYATQALLARVYWMKGDLDSAGIYARKVIDSKQFELVEPGEITEFVAQVISIKEGIWGLYNDKLTPIYRKMFYNSDGLTGSLPPLLCPRYDYPYLYMTDPNVVDMREAGWFRLRKGDEDSQRRLMKLFREDNMLEPTPSYPSGIKPGINMIRLPEMYLILAEALLEKEPDVARDYFDTFILSRGLKSLKEKGETLELEDINNEWRKEFIGEGLVFYNMKRQMQDIQVFSTGDYLEGNDEIYTLPIPDSEFEFRNDDEVDNDKI